MNYVTAVLEQDDDRPLLGVAEAIGQLLDLDVQQFRVPHSEAPDQAEAVIDALRPDDVEVAVLNTTAPHTVCWGVMPRSLKPLLVVPQKCTQPPRSISRILLPLDGAKETAESVAGMVQRALDSGAHVLAMHVFDSTTVPAFWDQASHSYTEWIEEFLLRNLPSAVDLDLRRGYAPKEVADEAEQRDVDMIMIGWAHDLSEGKARTVRHLVTFGSVPVLLMNAVPVRPEDVGLCALDK